MGPDPLLRAGVVAMAFQRALDHAEAYVGATAPNPPVGSALLDVSGGLLGCAAHVRAGSPHAEALAIAQCRSEGLVDAVRAVVVTLEPCNHFGRTPPCVEAILSTPANQVWIGVLDPNRGVAGGGAERLRQAGLTVRLADELDDPDAGRIVAACRALIAPFDKRVRLGLPWVVLKQAFDEAGSMIPPAGCKTFTSPDSLTFAHTLRRRADAILTGSGTVLADAPEFTVRRIADHPGKARRLVILDRRGRVPRAYAQAAEARGLAVRIESDLQAALERLGGEGALEVLVEAGPLLSAAVLRSGLWDEHVVIRKGAGPDGADDISIRQRAVPPSGAPSI